MTVLDFANMCVDSDSLILRLWDMDKEEEVYAGYANELPFQYEDAEVESFDLPVKAGEITLNVAM